MPNRRGSIEFAGVREVPADADCDIHGRRGSIGSGKRNSISTNISLPNPDSVVSNGTAKRGSLGSTSKRDTVDGQFGHSYLSAYTVLNRQESVDRELGINDYAIPRRRSSAGKTADANNR